MLNRALKLLRIYYQMTQADLSTRLGLSKSYLSEIESGRKEPSLALIYKYADVFKVPASNILIFSERLSEQKTQKSPLKLKIADRILRVLEWIGDQNRVTVKNAPKEGSV